MSASDRKFELGLIHIGKAYLARQAGMSVKDFDPDYRQLLQRVCGATSSADLDAAGREKLLSHMKSCGFKVVTKAADPATAARSQALDSPKHKKLRAMWYALADVDAVVRPRNAVLCDQAIEAWAKRQLGANDQVGQLDALRFANGAQMEKLIEEMKRWGERVKANIL